MNLTSQRTPIAAHSPGGDQSLEPSHFRQAFGRKLVCRPLLPVRLREQLWNDPDQLIENGIRLKSGRRCTVVRIEEGGRPFVLKRYNLRGPLHTAVHAVLSSRAARCWNVAWQFREQGIHTPQPLAYVENRLGPLRGRSYLLTEYVAGVCLDRAISLSPVESSAFATLRGNIADFWQRMRAGGLSHGDTKPANFLVAADGTLWVIDLDAARRHRGPAGFQRARARDRERLLRDWAEAPQVQEALAEVLPLDTQADNLWIEPVFLPAMQAAGLTTFDAIQETSGGHMLRRLANRENRRLDLPDPHAGKPRGAYLKRHWMNGAAARLGALALRPKRSEGRLEAECIRRLDSLGVPTMTLIAFGERFSARDGEESFVITEELHGFTQLDEFLEQRFDWQAPRRDANLERLIARVADVAARFHRLGFNHRDFYCCHFFVREEQSGRFDVRLIDLQRVQHRRMFRGRWLVKDLAQLAYSAGRHCIGAGQRMRFFKHYLGVRRLSPADKQLARRVLARERHMLRKLGPYK